MPCWQSSGWNKTKIKSILSQLVQEINEEQARTDGSFYLSILRVDRRDWIVVSRLHPRNGSHASRVATVIMLAVGKWSCWNRIWPADRGCTSKNRSTFVQIDDTRRSFLSREVRYPVYVSVSCFRPNECIRWSKNARWFILETERRRSAMTLVFDIWIKIIRRSKRIRFDLVITWFTGSIEDVQR